MTHAQHWRKSPPTPPPPTSSISPHNQPHWPPPFQFISPRGLPLAHHRRSNWLNGFASQQGEVEGAEKQQQLQYGDEVQGMSHEGSESGAELLLWHSCEWHSQPTVTLSYFHPGNRKHGRNILIRQRRLLSLFAHANGNSVASEEQRLCEVPAQTWPMWPHGPSPVSGSGCSNSRTANPKDHVQKAATLFLEVCPKWPKSTFQAIQRTRGLWMLKALEVTLTWVQPAGK